MMNYNNQEQALSIIKSRPENKHCADCNEKNPAWVSLSFGCLVCMRCSGIHRNMSTKVTRIKSTELDDFQPEWIELLDHIGNQIANLYWEKGLDKSKKPKPETDVRVLNEFIVTKYVKKRFINEFEEDPVKVFLETPSHLKLKKKHSHSVGKAENVSFTVPKINFSGQNSNKLTPQWNPVQKANLDQFNFDFSSQQNVSNMAHGSDFLDFSDVNENKSVKSECQEKKYSSQSNAFEFDFTAHNQKEKPHTSSPNKKRNKNCKSTNLWNNVPWDSVNVSNNEINHNKIQISNNFQGASVNVTINNYKTVSNFNFYAEPINKGTASNSNAENLIFSPKIVPQQNQQNFQKNSSQDFMNFSKPQIQINSGNEQAKPQNFATADFIMSLYKQTK